MEIDAVDRRPSGERAFGRIWWGATREEDARDYRDSLRADLREVRSVDRNVGAFILAHVGDGQAELLFVFPWEWMDAVLGFAGPNVES